MKKLKFITLTLAIIITLPMLQSCLDDNYIQRAGTTRKRI